MSIRSKIESVLFVATKPISVQELGKLLKVKEKEIGEALVAMAESYAGQESGLQLIKNNSKYQLVSSANNSQLVQEFVQDETSGELTRPSLEALTIIAYRGPISKLDLERIRGVNCSLIIRNLLIRGLIEEKFDKQKNEIYYNITLDFIRFLGVQDVTELPDYEKLNKDDTLDRVLENKETI